MVAEQIEKFDAVRKVLDTAKNTIKSGLEQLQLPKRHPVIKTETFIQNINAAIEIFRVELDDQEKQQPDVFDVDALRDEINFF